MYESKYQIMMDTEAGIGARVLRAAKMAHEANRIYRESIGETPGPHFESLPPQKIESILSGVLMILEAVLCGYEIEESDLHDAWADFVIRSGEVEDGNLVAWDKLPPEQAAKDTLFLSTVSTALALP